MARVHNLFHWSRFQNPPSLLRRRWGAAREDGAFRLRRRRSRQWFTRIFAASALLALQRSASAVSDQHITFWFAADCPRVARIPEEPSKYAPVLLIRQHPGSPFIVFNRLAKFV